MTAILCFVWRFPIGDRVADMTRLAFTLVALGGFLAGAAAMLALVDRLFGGDGPDLELAEPWGDV